MRADSMTPIFIPIARGVESTMSKLASPENAMAEEPQTERIVSIHRNGLVGERKTTAINTSAMCT